MASDAQTHPRENRARRLWFMRMFDQFASSDVLSNYTRTYSWMANQLGHAALGLFTVFLFIWITETLETARELWVSFGPGGTERPQIIRDENFLIGVSAFIALALIVARAQRAALSALRETRGQQIAVAVGLTLIIVFFGALTGEGRNLILMVATICALLSAVLLMLREMFRVKPLEDPELRRRMLSLNRWRITAVLALGLVTFFVLRFGLTAQPAVLLERSGLTNTELLLYADNRFAPVSVWLMFLVIVLLIKDRRFLAVSFIASVIASFIATDGFYIDMALRDTPGTIDTLLQASEDLILSWLSGDPCTQPFCENGFHRRLGGVLLAIALGAFWMLALRGQADAPEIVQDELRGTGNIPAESLPDGHAHGHRFETRRDQKVILIYSLVAAFALIAATWEGLEREWVLPIAASIMSMTIWLTKEFASDLPNVHTELSNATVARARKMFALDNKLPRIEQIRAAQTPRPIARAYFSDARWDSRTDGLFYFAGAWIAAGIATEAPVLTRTGGVGDWLSGSELIGILVFGAIFAFVGQNWILRQRAIDMIGTQRANRLAVFDAKIELWVTDTGLDCETPRRNAARFDTYRSLHILYDFARGWPGTVKDGFSHQRAAIWRSDPEQENPLTDFQHLIVFGRHGYGKAPLGSALVTEASLYDLPAKPSISTSLMDLFGLSEKTEAVRAGRLVDAATLCEYGTRERRGRHYLLSEVSNTPTRDLYLLPPEEGSTRPLARPQQLVTHEAPEDREPDRRAASLIVIDNFEFSLAQRAMSGDQEAIAEVNNIFFTLALNQMAVARRAESGEALQMKPKQTVWLIRYAARVMESADADPEEEPSPEELRNFIEWLRERITNEQNVPPGEDPGVAGNAAQSSAGAAYASDDYTPCAIAYLRLCGVRADTPATVSSRRAPPSLSL